MVIVCLLSVSSLAQMTTWTCPNAYAGQTLRVWNWDTYIAEDTIATFESLCEVTVVYDLFESNDEVVDALRAGTVRYDIIIPSGTAIANLSRDNLLYPLDKSAIPNIANIDESLLYQSFDPENTYSVPYLWGTIAVGYRTDAFPAGIQSWEQVWAHEGAVAWLDDRRSVMGIALAILGHNPNTENVEEIEAAKDYLLAQIGNVTTFAPDTGQYLLEEGLVDVAIEFNGDILALGYDCACLDYAYAIPEEGAALWVDNLAVPAVAENPALAMVFIDYILDPFVGASIANYTAYATPNQAATELGLIDLRYLENPAIYPSLTIARRLFLISEVSAEAGAVYQAAWDELLAAVESE